MKCFVISSSLLLLAATLTSAEPSSAEHPLLEPSEHGHETGMAAKGKRCHEVPKLGLQNILGSIRDRNLLPSSLRRRHTTDALKPKEPTNDDVVMLENRFNNEEKHTSGLSESQDRYFTIGSLGPGPKMDLVARILGVPSTAQLDRLVILAKNKDTNNKPAVVVQPVVIDTAHVFTTNEGKPAQIDLELHNVATKDKDDLINLTSQLNKELDAAIETKKKMLGDSHLTPEEIDKIIEHVVEHQNKKSRVSPQKVTGSVDNRLREAGEMDEIKKKIMDKTDKTRLKPINDEKVGAIEDLRTTSEVLPTATEPSAVSNNPENREDEDSLLGHKNLKKLKKFKKKNKGHHDDGYGYGYYRSNEDLEEAESPEAVDTEPEEDFVLGHKKKHKSKGKKGSTRYRSNENTDEEVIDLNLETEDDSILGHKKKHKKSKKGGQYRETEIEEETNDTTETNAMNEDDDLILGHKKKLKKSKLGKKGHNNGYYRANEDDNKESNEINIALGTTTTESDLPPQIFDDADHVWESIHPSSDWRSNNYPDQKPAGYDEPSYQKPQEQHQPAPVQPQGQPKYENQPAPQPEYIKNKEPEIYHATVPPYEKPMPANQYYPGYEQHPQPMYPNYPQAAYQEPQEVYPQEQPNYYQNYPPQEAYGPEPELYEEPEEYGPNPEYRPEEYFLGKPNEKSPQIPEDPKLKANFFENEYNRLKNLISNTLPAAETIPKKMTETQQQLVDQFAKVIESDLTDGQKLPPVEEEQLKRKISDIIEEDLDTKDITSGKARMEEKLNDLEKMIENDLNTSVEENEDNTNNMEFRTNKQSTDSPNVTPLNPVENLKNKLKESLSNLSMKLGKDNMLSKMRQVNEETGTPESTTKPSKFKKFTQTTAKPFDLKDIVDGLKTVPSIIINNAEKAIEGKTEATPVATTKVSKATEALDTKRQKVDEDEPNINIIDKVDEDPLIEDNLENLDRINRKKDTTSEEIDIKDMRERVNKDETVGCSLESLEDLRESDKKENFLDKLLHPHHNHRNHRKDPSHQRSDSNKPPTLPEIIEQLEENLHLPTLAPLPGLEQLIPTHHQQQQNPQQFSHVSQNDQPIPMSKIPPEILPPVSPEFVRPPPPPPPQFRQRNFPFPDNRFQMPIDEFERREMMQRQQPQMLGAVEHSVPHQNAMGHFGKIVPEEVHDRQTREVGEHIKPQKMYFVGDGIKLPLHMHKHKDGTLHLSVDLQKLCKCNNENCEHTKVIQEPDFLALEAPTNENQDETVDSGDAPLTMLAPRFSYTDAENEDNVDMPRAKRSPRFDYYDAKTSSNLDEKFDPVSFIKNIPSDASDEQIKSLHRNLEEYYKNEEKLQNESLDSEEMDQSIQKRVGLSENMMFWLRALNVDNVPNFFAF